MLEGAFDNTPSWEQLLYNNQVPVVLLHGTNKIHKRHLMFEDIFHNSLNYKNH